MAMRAAIFIGLASIAAPLASASPPAGAPAEQGTYSFEIGRAQGKIFDPWTGTEDPVELRSFRGSGAVDGAFVAPTIRVAPGRPLTVDLRNQLEPCDAEQRKAQRCFNDTNLHTHGLWVSPSGNSDNVLISIAPGERFRYRYEIPADHPAGTFWYHPHSHGSGFVQVGSGMAGALIVTGDRKPTVNRPGDIDILLKDAAGTPLRERVMLLQQIQYSCADEAGKIEGRMENDEYLRPWTCAPGRIGRIESDDNDWDWRWSGRFTGINGKVQPQLEAARVGQFERWRLVHAGTREKVRMRLHYLDPTAPDLRSVRGADQEAWIARHCRGEALPMWQIAADGLTRSAVRRTEEAVLFPGDRMDMLARFPAAGRYCLLQQVKPGEGRQNASRVLAVVEARGARAASDDPDALLQSLLTRAAEQSLSGSVRERVTADLQNGMRLSSFVWHKPIEKADVGGYREAILNIIEPPDTNGQVLFHINGRPYDHDRIDHVLPLGGTEEWHVRSLLGDHPLHLHVNPFQIVKIVDAQGRDVTDPAGPGYDPDYAGLLGEWKDTVLLKEGYRVAFRTRYERFTGDFVTHCHIMFHGDHGMMMNLRIADPATAPGAATHH
jgi:FtsP/CotA-like multicopper oxidase with cupredoxin domain